MSQHVIVGAGPIGSALALRLVEDGHDVRIVTRSGSGPDHAGPDHAGPDHAGPDHAGVERVAATPADSGRMASLAHGAIERVAADAADGARMTALTRGAAVLYNCANPAYHRWPTDWPPLAAALLAAAERSGAVLVTMANLYGYGPVDAPMTEQTPLAAAPGTKGAVRNRMWLDALAAHEAGRVRVTEARASDFYGPGMRSTSHLGEYFVPRLLAGKRPRILQGDPDTPHSWTHVDDVTRTLAMLAGDERAWGRPWHVPTDRPASAREVAARMARLAGVADPGVHVLPRALMRIGGLAVPLLRELAEVRYQFAAPFVLDSSAAQATFGLAPTPLDEGLAATVEWWRGLDRAAA